MKQEMTELPEYREIQNTPSQNAIDEAVKRGHLKGLMEGLKKGRISGYVDAIADIIDIITRFQKHFTEGMKDDGHSK